MDRRGGAAGAALLMGLWGFKLERAAGSRQLLRGAPGAGKHKGGLRGGAARGAARAGRLYVFAARGLTAEDNVGERRLVELAE